jgi:acetyltransferase-like isoleucine patch superfamily enzyme
MTPDRSPSTRQRLLELLMLSLLSDIPRPLGVQIRKLIYPHLFARMGRNVYIQRGCEFLGADAIELGDEVRILRDVRLNVKTRNSRLSLGNGVCLDRGVDINVPEDDCWIEIGDHAYLGAYVCVAGPGPIKIGHHTLIAAHSGIFSNNHRSYGLSREGIEIGNHCWLGCGVKVMDGTKIGDNTIVGAGAVVTKDIPANSVAVGVPARVIKPNLPT